MKTGAIIQARMSSERMPGKVLAELPFGSGTPSVAQVIRRVKAADGIQSVILATSERPEDQALLEIADAEGVIGFAGDLDDVLDRYYQAATLHNLDHIVRITGDCPCLDPGIIDRVIDHHLEHDADFTSNTLERTYPVGIDTAVIRMETLSAVWSMARSPEDREHVTSYIYDTAPDRFDIRIFEAERPDRRPDIRITLDTPRDYALLSIIFDALYHGDELFRLDRIIALFESEPWLLHINSGVDHDQGLRTVSEEIDVAIQYCRERGMHPIASILEEPADRISE